MMVCVELSAIFIHRTYFPKMMMQNVKFFDIISV